MASCSDRSRQRQHDRRKGKSLFEKKNQKLISTCLDPRFTYFGLNILFQNKKFVRSIPQWGGSCSKDGRYGLYAPSRGGLDLLDLRHGTVVRTLIPKVPRHYKVYFKMIL